MSQGCCAGDRPDYLVHGIEGIERGVVRGKEGERDGCS